MSALILSEIREAVKSRDEWKRATEVASRLAQTVRGRLPHDARKFLDLDHWLEVNLQRAQNLGLCQATGCHILDLGSGTGLFLFVCETLGHKAIGVDLPSAEHQQPERDIFAEMPPAFGVEVVREKIESFRPLEVSGKYDLITSFMICFNNHKLENEWGLREWDFFTRNLLSRLNPGGRLALRLNHHEERFGPRGYLDHETESFFASIGTIDDGNILISA